MRKHPAWKNAWFSRGCSLELTVERQVATLVQIVKNIARLILGLFEITVSAQALAIRLKPPYQNRMFSKRSLSPNRGFTKADYRPTHGQSSPIAVYIVNKDNWKKLHSS